MKREDMLAKIEAAFPARRTGDFSALQAIVTEDAAFSFAGEQSLLAALPGSGGVGVHLAARQLFDTIEMRSLERLQAVAEDNRVAILWRATLVLPEGPVRNPDVRPVGVRQFRQDLQGHAIPRHRQAHRGDAVAAMAQDRSARNRTASTR